MRKHKEPRIIINGIELTEGQSMTVRVAIGSMQFTLNNPHYLNDLGPIGPLYIMRLNEIQNLINKE